MVLPGALFVLTCTDIAVKENTFRPLLQMGFACVILHITFT
jgi:hypothetical protein